LLAKNPGEDEDVVGSDGCNDSTRRRVVVGDRDVALPVDALDSRTLVAHVSCLRESRGGVPDCFVVEDDEPFGVVKIAIGEDVIAIHDIGRSRSCSVTLLVKHNHETKIDRILLSVVDVESVLNLDGGDSDGPPDSRTGTITNGDLVQG